MPFTTKSPLLWEALPDSREGFMCPLGSPVPALPLGTGLSSPADSEPGGEGHLGLCRIPTTAQHRPDTGQVMMVY